MAILCHLLKGEAIIQEKLAKEKETTTAAASVTPAATTVSTPAPTRTTARTDLEDQGINSDHLQQLMDMGFPRELALDALLQTNTVEQATDYLLSHPGPLRQGAVSHANCIIFIFPYTYQRPISRLFKAD